MWDSTCWSVSAWLAASVSGLFHIPAGEPHTQTLSHTVIKCVIKSFFFLGHISGSSSQMSTRNQGLGVIEHSSAQVREHFPNITSELVYTVASGHHLTGTRQRLLVSLCLFMSHLYATNWATISSLFVLVYHYCFVCVHTRISIYSTYRPLTKCWGTTSVSPKLTKQTLFIYVCVYLFI